MLAEVILGVFSAYSEDALFTLFGAATLLPAVIYAATIALYLAKRKSMQPNGKFDLGVWEIPILVVAVLWLLFELALFRDTSFRDAWLYVLALLVIGAIYLTGLLVTRGRQALDMPGQYSIDKELDQKAQP